MCAKQLYYVFAFKKKGDSFSARLSLARAYRERMLRGARTLKDAQDKIDMWIVLSSYSEDCMATVLRDNPHSASELATSIYRYMELHPEGGLSAKAGVTFIMETHTRVGLTITEPRPLILKSSTTIPKTLVSQTHQDSFIGNIRKII